MKALHISFEGFTSTFKHPNINANNTLCAPVPSYSTIVGLISCCLGRPLKIDETRIGFKYEYGGKGDDLESLSRLKITDTGNLTKDPKPGITNREFHVNPVLDIYLTNLELKSCFLSPVGVPVLGRSQDISWITKIEEIEIEPVDEGLIKPTLIPYPCTDIGGRLIRYVDYYDTEITGNIRKPAVPPILYQIVPNSKEGILIKRDNLYTINNCDEVIYLHKLGCEE
ncbi:CRISPR-associated protein Cas5 [Methanococcus sp. CF]